MWQPVFFCKNEYTYGVKYSIIIYDISKILHSAQNDKRCGDGQPSALLKNDKVDVNVSS